MKEKTLNKYIGKTHGVLTVIALDHETYDKEKQRKRTYFKCKCNKCGNTTIVRSDKLTTKYWIPKCCNNCVNQQQHETAIKLHENGIPSYFKKRISSIKGNAKSRNINMQLTDNEIYNIIQKSCYYCKEKEAFGIDRIDSTKDYTIDNCVPCCFICNRIKNKYSIDVFLDKISKIYNNFFIERSTTIPKGSTLQAKGNGNGSIPTIN
jgi:hypothetical protein